MTVRLFTKSGKPNLSDDFFDYLRKKDREKRRESKRRFDATRRGGLKLEVFRHYSPRLTCERCGFGGLPAIILHHTSGAKVDLSGSELYRYLKANNYPEGYELRCQNCVFINGRGGSHGILKREVFKHYSPELRCVKCGFDDIRALSLDHVEGGGRKQAEKLGFKYSSDLYRWVSDNGYPDGYQVLCMNDQWIKAYENFEW